MKLCTCRKTRPHSNPLPLAREPNIPALDEVPAWQRNGSSMGRYLAQVSGVCIKENNCFCVFCWTFCVFVVCSRLCSRRFLMMDRPGPIRTESTEFYLSRNKSNDLGQRRNLASFTLRLCHSILQTRSPSSCEFSDGTDYVKLMITDLICVKRSRPYGPFSRPHPLSLKPPQGEALSKAL